MTTQCIPEKKRIYKGVSNGSHFFFHRDKIEQEIAKSISFLGEKSKLRDACEYALTNGGKRFRPLIVLMVAEGLGRGLNVFEAALSVEYFHTASLIADDLPCMDNDDERREKPSVHKVYGETIALLSSYALITAAFEKIHRNAKIMKDAGAPHNQNSDRACVLALETATHCAGILGATGGQFMDIFPPSISLDVVKQVIYKKTVTLFEVSFVFGWIFGGGDLDQIDYVKKAAYHLGMAFQIADDIGDLLQDDKNQRDINLARLVGKERALCIFDEEMKLFEKQLSELHLFTPSFKKMSDMLCAQAAKYIGS
ncbi:MAG: polyprenyl synthetase family protein [Chlamydiae bacterium]|nr:polyprenyl synthetase family protein [Chlamydiota bacterium]